jgi:hypothetical protein
MKPNLIEAPCQTESRKIAVLKWTQGTTVPHSSNFLKCYCWKSHRQQDQDSWRHSPVSFTETKCSVPRFLDFNRTFVSRFKFWEDLWDLCTRYDSHCSLGKFRKIHCTETKLYSERRRRVCNAHNLGHITGLRIKSRNMFVLSFIRY